MSRFTNSGCMNVAIQARGRFVSLSLTPTWLTNIADNVSVSSRLWVFKCVCKSCQGSFARVICTAGEAAADENGGKICFSACVEWKAPLVSLKEPRQPRWLHTGAINRHIGCLMFQGKSSLWSLRSQPRKIPLPCSFPPHPPLCRSPVLW